MMATASQQPSRRLLDWMTEPDSHQGLHFAQDDGEWEFWSYRDLAELTRTAAARLTELGATRGSVVAVVSRTSPGLVASFFGAFAIGAVPCSVPHPFAFLQADRYEDHVGQLLAVAKPDIVLCDADSAQQVAALCTRRGLPVPELIVTEPAAAPVTLSLPGTGDLAMIQFTSGSSGYSKAVKITTRNLESNLGAIREWIGVQEGITRGISWLPSHHDMGMVGVLLNVVVASCETWLMQPEQFIRDPTWYLETISRHRINFTVMPNFGMEYTVRRASRDRTADLDLSCLDGIILGAERLDPELMKRFSSRFEANGLLSTALLPAYGGAEATLAVTGLPRGTSWSSSSANGSTDKVVTCGEALKDVTVRVMTHSGKLATDGEIGEIVVMGPAISPGYVAGSSESTTSIFDNQLFTGDAGFMRDGKLFVIGRYGDGFKVNGTMLFAETIEADLAQNGIPQRSSAVLLGNSESGRPYAVVVLVKPRPGWRDIAVRVASRRLPANVAIEIYEASQSKMLLTSSGKPRRKEMFRNFLAMREAAAA